MRIVQMANFVMATSGGLRTALQGLGEGYRRAGHECVLIVPGDRWSDRTAGGQRLITVPGSRVPGTGGYLIVLCTATRRAPPSWRRTGWRSPTGRPCAARPVGAGPGRRLMVSHESLDGLLATAGLRGDRRWPPPTVQRGDARRTSMWCVRPGGPAEEFVRVAWGTCPRCRSASTLAGSTRAGADASCAARSPATRAAARPRRTAVPGEAAGTWPSTRWPAGPPGGCRRGPRHRRERTAAPSA